MVRSASESGLAWFAHKEPVAVLGAGPAGLMAAETLVGLGVPVTVFDRMPSAGRKFLLAGRGGLNLTHSEQLDRFLARYDERSGFMARAVGAFPPDRLRAWAEALGQPTFVGSSGRVFPTGMKAAPLLRAWLRRLESQSVRLATRHRWLGWTEAGGLRFETAGGWAERHPPATVLALGGASWPRMGSDGAWLPYLRQRGVEVASLRPSNCGVDVSWPPELLARAEGRPLKRIALAVGEEQVRGEAVITRTGLEGGAVYALSAPIRAALDRDGTAFLHLDLRPDLPASELQSRVDGPRQGRSLSNHLRRAGFDPAAVALVQMAAHAGRDRAGLAALIKSVEVHVTGLQPIERAISSAGGIIAGELDGRLMLRRLPGVFVAGEMLDWDAPTGGYLLQGCFATGMAAGLGVAAWLRDQATAAIASR